MQDLEVKVQEQAVELARYENHCSELSQLVSQVGSPFFSGFLALADSDADAKHWLRRMQAFWSSKTRLLV